MRKFEKISFEQYKKDICDNFDDYKNYNLPKRSTKYSAGYDFEASQNYIIKPNEIIKIPTGIKVTMNRDEMLMIVVRSSMGFKYNVRMCNQVGIIESDYYNNEDNEGHFSVKLINHGEKDFEVKIGDRICQGIFSKYLVTSDDKCEIKRTGGIGSTNKEGK